MNEPYVILDIRGLVIHAYHTGDEKEGSKSAQGGKIHSPAHTLDIFLSRYLFPILQNVRLNRIIAVWDGGNHYRLSLTQGTYKAHRKDADPEVKEAVDASIKAIKRLLSGLGIVQISVRDTEADDVIAYLCQQLPHRIKTIYTVDRDLIQLACRHTAVMLKDEFVQDMGGTEPGLVALNKAIVGDASDGYGGVDGYGEKAWEAFNQDANRPALYRLADALRSEDYQAVAKELAQPLPVAEDKWQRKWQELGSKSSQLMNMYRIARLHPELVNQRVASGFNVIQWHKRLPSRTKIESLLDETGCVYLLQRLDSFLPQRWILDSSQPFGPDEIAEARQLFAASPFVAIDWESYDPNQYQNLRDAARRKDYVDVLSQVIVSSGFTFGSNLQYTFYATYGHKDSNNLPLDVLVELMDAIPEDKPIVAHNAEGFERPVFKLNTGFDLPILHDTKLMASHVEEWNDQDLKSLSLKWLGHKQKTYNETVGPGRTMADLTAEEAFSYGADDPFCTAHLYDLFTLILDIEGTLDFVHLYEATAARVMSDSFLDGISIDTEELARQQAEDQATFDRNMARVRELLARYVDPEQARKGAEALLAEEEPVIRAKARDEGWSEEQTQQALDNFHDRMLEYCTYRTFTKEDKPIGEFKFTKANLTKVAEKLDLPPMEKDSDTYLTQYAYEHKDKPGEQGEFCQRILQSKAFRKKPETPEYSAFAEFCERIMGPRKTKEVKHGTELNLDSNIQMKAVLYGMLGLPIRMRGFEASGDRGEFGLEAGAQANKDAFAAALANDAPEGSWQREVLEGLVEVIKCNMRIKTFHKAYPLWVHPIDTNIHPRCDTTGTSSRRPTSSGPNLLQLPKRDGAIFRRVIVPNRNKGHNLIVSCDWSSEELRVGAFESRDPRMLSCFIGDTELDMHAQVAATTAGVSYDEFMLVYKDQDHPLHKKYKDIRTKAKSTVFGGAYGIGKSKLSRQLLQPEEVAQMFLDKHRATFGGFYEWKDRIREQVNKLGFVRTRFGSYKHLFNQMTTADSGMLGYLERSAINYVIQGACADYLKTVLTKLYQRGSFERHRASMVAPIYDEIVVSLHSDYAYGFITELVEEMEAGFPGMDVPMPAEPSLGKNFGDQIELGRRPTREVVEKAIQAALGPESNI